MSPTPKKSPARFIPLVLVLGGVGWYAFHRYQLAHAPYEWSGTVEARTIALGSRAGGRIKEIKVKEGDRIKLGDALVILEPGDWPAQKEQADAALAQAEATLDKLKAGARPEEIDAAKARAQTAQAAFQEVVTGTRPEQVAAAKSRWIATESAVEKAQHDVDRLHKLRDAGAAVPADVDNAEIALKGAIATLRRISSTSSSTAAVAKISPRRKRARASRSRRRSSSPPARASRTSASPRRR